MMITYDISVDAAYIQLVDEMRAGSVAFSYACDPAEVKGMIHLDFDADGVLVGIEVLGARAKLPENVLEGATRL